MTTVQLQTDTSIAGQAGFYYGQAGVYPYSAFFYPDGIQAVSGTAKNADGSAATGGVGLYVNGLQLGAHTAGTDTDGNGLNLGIPGLASIGADGSYYVAYDRGTLPDTGATVAASLVTAGVSSPIGLGYTDRLAFSAQNPTATGAGFTEGATGPNLVAGAITAQTSATTLTELQSRLPAAFGASSYAVLTAALPNPGWAVNASGDFTLDQAVSLFGADGLSLHAAGLLEIEAPVSIGGGGAVSLSSGTSWGLVGAGKIDFGGVDQGATLSINGSSYTLIYDGDLASVRAAGDYALAHRRDRAEHGLQPRGDRHVRRRL